ncbi:uncharacterized protein LOC142324750 [Lycorma delicatula]|uniref:uncharacterized protein LOC142324750 n=1 Tax=Lycorma delicatula TaxID=130591 RepID=UPI003F51879A
MADKPKVEGRPMIYPYTHSAVLAQFPYKHYFEKGWVLKYYLIAVALTVPLYYKISKGVNSPENKLKWKKIREEWYGPHGHH